MVEKQHISTKDLYLTMYKIEHLNIFKDMFLITKFPKLPTNKNLTNLQAAL